MSKTSLALLIFVLISICIFLYVTFGYQLRAALPAFTKPSPTAAQPSQSTLSLIPNPLTVQPGRVVSVDVRINVQGTAPDFMQFEIGYDPTVLTFTDITPGKYVKNPEIVFNTLLPRTGRLSYALACPETAKTNCVDPTSDNAATITFMVNDYATKKETSVTFFPKTRIQVQGANDTKLKTQNAKIMIKGIVPQASPSAAKLIELR